MTTGQGSPDIVQISYYVPESHLQQTKEALFKAGAGRIGNYDCCAWQTLGIGQFRPLPGSKPALGQQNVMETVQEYKVEVVCEREKLESAIQALKRAHLYEEPAYFVTSFNLLK